MNESGSVPIQSEHGSRGEKTEQGALHSATEHPHSLIFFDDDQILCNEVAEFLAAGLRASDAVVIVAAETHLEEFGLRLSAIGFDVESARASGDLTFLDARAVLTTFMVEGSPDWALFSTRMGEIIRNSRGTRGGARVRIYGEMVDVLWKEGNRRAAIELEGFWNDLAKLYDFSLLCAYAMGGFLNEADARDIKRVFDSHTLVIPTEITSRLANEDPRTEELKILQQRARGLEREVAIRRELEAALKEALEERRRAQEVLKESQVELREAGVIQARRARQAELAARIGAAFVRGGPQREVLTSCCQAAVDLLDAAFARIWTVDAAGEILELQASAGLYTRIDGAHARVQVGSYKIGLIARERRPYLTNHVQSDERIHDQEWARREGMEAFAGYPLFVEERLVGVFAMFARQALPADTLTALGSASDMIAVGLERSRIESERERLVADLSRTVHFSEVFTGVLAHDLRNPLGAIVASASLLRRLHEPEKQVKPLKRILDSADRMSRMINQLLDFTRIRLGGGIPLSCDRTDLGEICASTIEELVGSHTDREIVIERSGELVGMWDHDRIAQLLSNLIGNACENARERSRILVLVEGQESSVLIRIENEGAIPPELLPVIFEPLRSGGRRANAGLGLGLYISHQIVLAHRGRIWVESDEPGGTRFSVELPRLSIDSTGTFRLGASARAKK